jgi:succinate dehydrogenase / fumarate reductase, iron-sulfur subunit
MSERLFRVWRGGSDGELSEYRVEVNEGEVVLDVLHRLQATQAPDLAVRWNCKAGKCGSCSVEINGMPRLSCMTRMSVFTEDETVTVTPLRSALGTNHVSTLEIDRYQDALEFSSTASF